MSANRVSQSKGIFVMNDEKKMGWFLINSLDGVYTHNAVAFYLEFMNFPACVQVFTRPVQKQIYHTFAKLPYFSLTYWLSLEMPVSTLVLNRFGFYFWFQSTNHSAVLG